MEYVLKTCEKNQWKIDTLCFDPANASKIMMDLSNDGYCVEEVTTRHVANVFGVKGFQLNDMEKSTYNNIGSLLL